MLLKFAVLHEGWLMMVFRADFSRNASPIDIELDGSWRRTPYRVGPSNPTPRQAAQNLNYWLAPEDMPTGVWAEDAPIWVAGEIWDDGIGNSAEGSPVRSGTQPS
jgi:hypothetical protein